MSLVEILSSSDVKFVSCDVSSPGAPPGCWAPAIMVKYWGHPEEI